MAIRSFLINLGCAFCMVGGTTATGVSQGTFMSYLMAQKLSEGFGVLLTECGYPGSSNQVEYLDGFTGSNQWNLLTNVTLTNSTLTFADLTSPLTQPRFYRVVMRGVTPLPVSSHLVWISPRQFLMGSPVTEQDRNADEGPQTLVTLTSGFYIGKYLVTQGDYLAVMSNNPSYFIGDTNRPVESMGWFNATNYCDKLTRLEQAAGELPTNWCYRLPREAEWEYACRAG